MDGLGQDNVCSPFIRTEIDGLIVAGDIMRRGYEAAMPFCVEPYHSFTVLPGRCHVQQKNKLPKFRQNPPTTHRKA